MKKVIIISFTVIIILFVAYFIFLYFKGSDNNKIQSLNLSEISTIMGEYQGSKGGGVVSGVYIPGNELKDSNKYIGKIIELKGVLSDYPCPEDNDRVTQCFNGPMMIKIQSVKEINK